MQEIRYLDKLIDELAKGKAMEKILRARLRGPLHDEGGYLIDGVDGTLQAGCQDADRPIRRSAGMTSLRQKLQPSSS